MLFIGNDHWKEQKIKIISSDTQVLKAEHFLVYLGFTNLEEQRETNHFM